MKAPLGQWGIEDFVRERCEHRLRRNPSDAKAQELLERMADLTSAEQVQEAMRLEHGYVIPVMQGRVWGVEELSLAKVTVPHPRHLQGAMDEPNYYADLDLSQPIGILLYERGQYRLLDGYHRLAALRKKEEVSKALFVVGVGREIAVETEAENSLDREI